MMELSDYETEINWEAPLTAKHRALELLAWMVRNEWPAGVAEAIETWGPFDLSDADRAVLREVFPVAGEAQPGTGGADAAGQASSAVCKGCGSEWPLGPGESLSRCPACGSKRLTEQPR